MIHMAAHQVDPAGRADNQHRFVRIDNRSGVLEQTDVFIDASAQKNLILTVQPLQLPHQLAGIRLSRRCIPEFA
jgi:hypothetical protein